MTQRVSQEAVEAVAARLYEEFSASPLGPWPPKPGKSSGTDYAEAYRDKAREIIDDALPALREQLEAEVREGLAKELKRQAALIPIPAGSPVEEGIADGLEQAANLVRTPTEQEPCERCGGSGEVYEPNFKGEKGAWLPCPDCKSDPEEEGDLNAFAQKAMQPAPMPTRESVKAWCDSVREQGFPDPEPRYTVGDTQFVFNVPLDDDPTLFERREDAEAYAALFVDGEVEEVTVMGTGLAASFISEAEADIEAER